MNKADRADLDRAAALVSQAQEILRGVGEREQEKFDNTSEGLQQTERGQRMEEVSGELDDLASTLDDVLESIEQAKE